MALEKNLMADTEKFMRTYPPLSEAEALEQLNRQIARIRAVSPFYARRYAGLSAEPLSSLEELKTLPCMTQKDIVRGGKQLLCCPPGQVRRMVTMQTSGTTGAPKRLAFSDRDLADTADFFREGMRLLCGPGDRVMIFMPGSHPDGLCDLLSRGIRGFGGIPRVYGPIRDYADAARVCQAWMPEVMVGVPVQIRRLALTAPDLRPRRVLLSADYGAPALFQTVERVWGCQALNHYGMTESGLGCAVETPVRDGMHIRRDILLETLEDGELALTTLRRQAMPLIRYRTGDLGEILSGGILKAVYGRKAEREQKLSVCRLDQILFACDPVLDYQAGIRDGCLTVAVAGGRAAETAAGKALEEVGLGMAVKVYEDENVFSDGVHKRSVRTEEG